jgi:hypothetical protein
VFASARLLAPPGTRNGPGLAAARPHRNLTCLIKIFVSFHPFEIGINVFYHRFGNGIPQGRRHQREEVGFELTIKRLPVRCLDHQATASIYQSTIKLMNISINRSIDQSINRSSNQSIHHSSIDYQELWGVWAWQWHWRVLMPPGRDGHSATELLNK